MVSNVSSYRRSITIEFPFDVEVDCFCRLDVGPESAFDTWVHVESEMVFLTRFEVDMSRELWKLWVGPKVNIDSFACGVDNGIQFFGKVPKDRVFFFLRDTETSSKDTRYLFVHPSFCLDRRSLSKLWL